jgi:anaerobic selenocysteine-containing dehydrogenase
MAMAESWQKTACILCSQVCGVEVELEGRRLACLRGDRAHPLSQGYTCEKALCLDDYQNGKDRLTSPLRRRADGTFEPIDWSTAISEVAARLAAVRDAHGGESIVYYGGGEQGSHLGGAHARATRAALGSVYTSSALAHEKVGELWVGAQLYGVSHGHPSGDFEHAEVAVFVGRDPFQSHGFPRARRTLEALSTDPARALVVLDPRRTETAARAGYHLQIRPGTGAFCLGAILGVLVEEDLVDHAFLRDHASGVEALSAALAAVPIAEHCEKAGVPELLVREAARRIARAASVAVLDDRGLEQAPHDTVGSYLGKLVYLLTGNFAKRGAMNLPSRLTSLDGDEGGRGRVSPVGARRAVAGLLPASVIPDEILTCHPRRFRAMIVEGADPACSIAGGSGAGAPGVTAAMRMREALAALDLLVVIDVSMSETAQRAHYVLPAPSPYEKWEAAFFDVGFPRNVFQLRAPILDPLPGTLAEPEIHRRLVRALGALRDQDLAELRASTRFMRVEGRGAFADAFFQAMAARPHLRPLAPMVLYETLGPSLPDGAAAAAVLWGAAHRCATRFPDSVRRAGFTGESRELGEQLFDAILMRREGVVFTVDDYAETWQRLDTADKRVRLAIPELLAELAGLAGEDPGARVVAAT